MCHKPVDFLSDNVNGDAFTRGYVIASGGVCISDGVCPHMSLYADVYQCAHVHVCSVCTYVCAYAAPCVSAEPHRRLFKL